MVWGLAGLAWWFWLEASQVSQGLGLAGVTWKAGCQDLKLLARTPMRGLSVWLGLPHSMAADFYEQLFQHREPGLGVGGGEAVPPSVDPASEVRHCHSCHILFITKESPRPAKSQAGRIRLHF